VLLISGPAGIGKTALVQAMAARAGREGGSCYVVTGSIRERGHPFGVLDRLIRSMCLAGMADPFPGGIDAGQDFFAMMKRLSAAVCEFAGGRPLLVGVDDVHFADEQSLRCLSYLIGRIESSGVVVLLSDSSSYERDMADLRAEMLHLPYCHWVRLAPLTAADIAEQVRERSGGLVDEAFVQFCAQVSGGVPLLLHALIDDMATASGPGTDEPGASFRQAVLRSLHRCAPATAGVAQAIAVVGDLAEPELVAELGGVDVNLVEESIRDLRDMGLLGPGWFRHPQIRSAVLAGIPLPSLPVMQSRAAELLHETGAPAHAVAEQLIAAQDGGKAPWRVAILEEAAREAMATGDVDSAVSSLRHAVAASSDEAQRARAGVRLAEALWHADPGRAARRLTELGRDARAGLLTGPDLLIVVNQLLWWGEFAAAGELLRLVGAEAGVDSALALLWAYYFRASSGAGYSGEPGRPADSPLAYAGLIAAATDLSSTASRTFDGVKTNRADQILGSVRAGTPLTPALYALLELVQTGRLDEAVAWCDRLQKEDWINRAPMRRVMIRMVEAVAMLRDGACAAALGCIQEVFDAVPPPSWGVVAGLPLSVAIRASIDLGDDQSARSFLAVPVPPAMFDSPFAVPCLQALESYHVAMGHPETARTYARSCAELVEKWGVDQPGPPSGGATLSDSGTDAPPGACETPCPGAEEGAKLTEAEQRVASLAAVGNTNRQIAERLSITVSTVEQHLTKIYRKLNVRSRSGLQASGY
jgi:DNA-binding CsgD family transcriptional regulator